MEIGEDYCFLNLTVLHYSFDLNMYAITKFLFSRSSVLIKCLTVLSEIYNMKYRICPGYSSKFGGAYVSTNRFGVIFVSDCLYYRNEN